MVIEKVFGLSATAVPLSERFGVLQAAGRPQPVRQRRLSQTSQGPNTNKLKNRVLIEQLALRSEVQAALAAKKRAQLRQRIGQLRSNSGGWGGGGGLRRWGSEGSLFSVAPVRRASFSSPGLNGRLGRANSVSRAGSVGRAGSVSRAGSYGNLSRSASYGNLSQATFRGRGRGRRPANRMMRQRGAGRGRFFNPGQRNGVMRPPMRGRGRGRGVGRATRGRGMQRNQPPKPVPTKEELDEQIDQYMACTKSALDKELDAYMDNADTSMDFN